MPTTATIPTTMVLTYADIAQELDDLIANIDLHGIPEQWAVAAVEQLTLHYNLDLTDISRLYPPSPVKPHSSDDIEQAVLRHLEHAMSDLAMSRASYAVLDSAMRLITTAVLSEPDPKAAAVWALNRLITTTGIAGVVHDPTDSDFADAAARYLEMGDRLVDRYRRVTLGEEDAPF